MDRRQRVPLRPGDMDSGSLLELGVMTQHLLFFYDSAVDTHRLVFIHFCPPITGSSRFVSKALVTHHQYGSILLY